MVDILERSDAFIPPAASKKGGNTRKKLKTQFDEDDARAAARIVKNSNKWEDLYNAFPEHTKSCVRKYGNVAKATGRWDPGEEKKSRAPAKKKRSRDDSDSDSD